MIRWFLRRQIAAFERAWNYDAGYLFDLIDTDPRAMLNFGKVQYLTKYRKDIPVAAYCAAGLIAAMAEDCGPCTQLGIDMAQRESADPEVLRAVVTRDYIAMPYKVALAARLTEATLDHAPWADDLREEVIHQFGQRGLASLAFAMVAARCVPILKYVLGHGKTCTRVTIAGESQRVLLQMSRAADDAVLYSDGGGKRLAAFNPIRGADKIARLFEGLARKNAALATIGARPAIVNGMAGFVLHEADGSIDTMAFEYRNGRIVAIYLVRNPDKLQHVSP